MSGELYKIGFCRLVANPFGPVAELGRRGDRTPQERNISKRAGGLVAELAYALASGASGETLAGSNPAQSTSVLDVGSAPMSRWRTRQSRSGGESHLVH